MRLAQQFAPYCRVLTDPRPQAVAYTFRMGIESDEGPHPIPATEDTSEARYLDGGDLMGAPHLMRTEIRRGVPPAGLGRMTDVPF